MFTLMVRSSCDLAAVRDVECVDGRGVLMDQRAAVPSREKVDGLRILVKRLLQLTRLFHELVLKNCSGVRCRAL